METRVRTQTVRVRVLGPPLPRSAYELLVRTRELPAAVDTALALPHVRFILDHLAKPPIAAGGDALAAWAHALRLLAALPNVAAKVSGLVTEADWSSWAVDDLAGPVRVALEAFGPERLLFGSDWPVCLVAAPYDRVLDASREALHRAGLTRSHPLGSGRRARAARTAGRACRR